MRCELLRYTNTPYYNRVELPRLVCPEARLTGLKAADRDAPPGQRADVLLLFADKRAQLACGAEYVYPEAAAEQIRSASVPVLRGRGVSSCCIEHVYFPELGISTRQASQAGQNGKAMCMIDEL